MVKLKATLFGCALISLSGWAGPQGLECQQSSRLEENLSEIEKVVQDVEKLCPKPTPNKYQWVCGAIDMIEDARTPAPGIRYAYQEHLLAMACVDPSKDSTEVVKAKIQKFWMENRVDFRCYNFPGSLASEMNVMKFTLNSGFTHFLIDSIRKYKLDMNFIDPKDNKTLLDFVQLREAELRRGGPSSVKKADEYKSIYDLLVQNGALHTKDLPKK